MHCAVLISCSLVLPLLRRGQKNADLQIPCAAQLDFQTQRYQPFSESKKNDQNSSNFTMSRWLFSWCHSEPPHVWHCCWESWLKLNYGLQGKVWTQLKMPLKISFSVITYAIHLVSATFLLLTHTASEHTHILITENVYSFP